MPRRKDRAQISFTTTKAEREAAKVAAAKQGMSLAEFSRWCIRRGVEETGISPGEPLPGPGKYDRNSE